MSPLAGFNSLLHSVMSRPLLAPIQLFVPSGDVVVPRGWTTMPASARFVAMLLSCNLNTLRLFAGFYNCEFLLGRRLH